MNVRPPPVVLVLGIGVADPSPLPLPRLPVSRFHVFDQRCSSDGVEAAKALRPDVVLVDVGRDHARGLDLCRSLHAEPETRSIPLIAITGDATIGRFMITMRVKVCDADSLSHEINGLIS